MEKENAQLLEVIQKLSFCKSLDEIVDIVRTAARRIVDADGATFVLREDDRCYYVDEDAIGTLFSGNRFPAEFCISGISMINKETIVVPDIYSDPRIPHDVYKPTFVKSLCMTPIRIEAPIGAIGVYWRTNHATSPEEAKLLSFLANSTSLAMENVSLQTQLKARLELVERLSRLKNEFIRNVSHELRTPLNHMLGWAHYLKENSGLEDMREAVAAIKASGERQEAIISDLLDCSDVMAGEMKFQRSNFELGELIQPLVNSFQFAIEKRGHKIGILAEQDGVLVEADRARCLEVLRHVLSNAIKFSPPGSEIRILASHDGSSSVLTIEDDGIGIAPDYLPRVFDLFSQADGSLTRKHGGTGLGLSLSRYLAEAQGGSLSVESPGENKGTRVTLRIPNAEVCFEPKKAETASYMAKVFDRLMPETQISSVNQSF